MKLVAIENCRLTALFQITRHKGQTFLPEAAAMLASRYNFSKYPQSYEEMLSEKVEFKHGKFGDVAIDNLEIYNDGVIISSRSDTDIIDSFLAEFRDWLQESLDLSFIKTHAIDNIYESIVVVQTDKNIFKPLEALSEIANMLQSNLKETIGLDVKYEPFGWSFSADPALNPALKPIGFRIERRIGMDYSLKNYISSAPLKLKQHLSLLEKLETLV